MNLYSSLLHWLARFHFPSIQCRYIEYFLHLSVQEKQALLYWFLHHALWSRRALLFREG